MEGIDIQAIVRQAIEEFATNEQSKNEPAYKAELQEERKRREQLERRLNELVAENKRSRQIAADNLNQLKDEIYRVCYLMIQAGSSSGGGRQSGLSKQLDFNTTQEVLRGYGDVVKETMKQVLWAIAAARQDGISIGVSGLDEFDIDDLSTELDDAQKLLNLGIGSETLTKQVFKKLALKYLSDARQEVKNQVAEEIDRMKYQEGVS